MKCFYHNDRDGEASAFSVYYSNSNVEVISINYGQNFPFSLIKDDEHIWIVDYSIEPKEMDRLLEITPNVIWIDHHKTAINKYANYDKEIKGIRKIGVAACVLTWEFIKGEDVPECIKLIGDRDIWDWKYGEKTKYFYAGSELEDTLPKSEFWINCVSDASYMDKIIENGKTVERYKDKRFHTIAKQLGYEIEFHGYKCFAVNVPHVSSDAFGDAISRYDILIPHCRRKDYWTLSLYTEKDHIDVSEIAQIYGGGGHKQASGFQCKNLPWIKV